MLRIHQKNTTSVVANSKNMFAARRICLQVLSLIALLTVLPTTNGLPAKAGVSSKSLETYALPVSSNSVSSSSENSEHSEKTADGRTLTTTSASYKITVYPWNNHLGRPAQMDWTAEEVTNFACKEIPSRWQGKVRSVHTHNNCVILFSRPGCDGSSKVVGIGSPSHNRLSDLCFQRKPMSAKPCSSVEIESLQKEQS